jgi:hypothetical protein
MRVRAILTATRMDAAMHKKTGIPYLVHEQSKIDNTNTAIKHAADYYQQ